MNMRVSSLLFASATAAVPAGFCEESCRSHPECVTGAGTTLGFGIGKDN
jgi:hypothetical protein